MKFAFYGTLRRDQYNYRAFGLDTAAVYKETITVPGYKMVSLGGYPKVYPSDSNDDTIVAEIFEINDVDVASGIHRMEVGAGYKTEKIDTSDGKAFIYVATSPTIPPHYQQAIIPSGDWVKYNTEKSNAARTLLKTGN